MKLKINESKELKDLLEHLYLIGELSTREISYQFSVDHKTIQYWMNNFGILLRTHKETLYKHGGKGTRIYTT